MAQRVDADRAERAEVRVPRAEEHAHQRARERVPEARLREEHAPAARPRDARADDEIGLAREHGPGDERELLREVRVVAVEEHDDVLVRERRERRGARAEEHLEPREACAAVPAAVLAHDERPRRARDLARPVARAVVDDDEHVDALLRQLGDHERERRLLVERGDQDGDAGTAR